MKVKFVAEEKYMPRYANSTDACMDLKAKIQQTEKDIRETFGNFTNAFAVTIFGEGFEDMCDTETTMIIMPGETRKVRSGVQAAVPEGYVMKMYVRSSTGIKKNLVLANGTGIIDAGYRDEIIMALHNIGKEPVEIKDGDRICQFIILPYPKIEPEFVQDDEDFRQGDRGGGIGSTGT